MHKRLGVLIGLAASATLAVSAVNARDLSSYGPAPSYRAMQDAAEQAVLSDLKDPDSAKFDWSGAEVKLGKRGWFICGRVNARNSYGGYEGYSQFLARKAADQGGMSVTVKMAPGNLTWNECFNASLASPNEAN